MKSDKVATLEGRYLTAEDRKFLDTVEKDIDDFLKNTTDQKRRRVLLLPRLSAYRRYLVHTFVADKFWRLTTFSVGEGDEKALAVCHEHELRSAIESGLCRNSALLVKFPTIKAPSTQSINCEEKSADGLSPSSKSANGSGKTRLPQRFYVPPARRQRSPPPRMNNHVEDEQQLSMGTGDKKLESDSKDIPSDEDSWDKKYDDNGDPTDPAVLEELGETLGKIHLTKPEVSNYLSFSPGLVEQRELEDNLEFSNVLELYDFPSDFRSHDLKTYLCSFGKDQTITWVDDNHALAVFNSTAQARMAYYNTKNGIVKRRPLSQASVQSLEKSKKVPVLSNIPRPETSSVMAKRLVSGALGIRIPISKEDVEKEKLRAKEARERRRVAKQQKKDNWGDD